MMKRALILVDLQNDFMPGGSLAVAEGDTIIPLANQLQAYFDLVVATKDWHPADHGSFAINHKPGDVVDLDGIPQILWPAHCVQNTPGAEFISTLNTAAIKKVFHKGVNPQIDSYSTFFDNAHRRSTGLADYLREQGVEEVYLMGLATDYCVKYSVLDACELGFKTYVIEDGCRGIDLAPRDSQRALAAMKKAGAAIIHSSEILSAVKKR